MPRISSAGASRATRRQRAQQPFEQTTFISPVSWRRMFERALQMSDGQIRFLGLVSVVAGLAMLLAFWS